MDRRVVYLLGGEKVEERSSYSIMKKALNDVEDPRVLIIPWTTSLKHKLERYKSILLKYFSELGSRRISFLDSDINGMESIKFHDFNVIYLPGGDPFILMKNLKRNSGIISYLKDFKGVIIGNSAGAMALSNMGYGFEDDKIIRCDGIGLVDFNIIVHYDSSFDNLIFKHLRKYFIYAIPSNSAIIIKYPYSISFEGTITIFMNSRKFNASSFNSMINNKNLISWSIKNLHLLSQSDIRHILNLFIHNFKILDSLNIVQLILLLKNQYHSLDEENRYLIQKIIKHTLHGLEKIKSSIDKEQFYIFSENLKILLTMLDSNKKL